MRKITAIYTVIISLFFSSCTGLFGEGQLELAPVEDINEEKVFSDYALFRQYADHTYSYVPGHLGRLWDALVADISDESRSNRGSMSTSFNLGSWSGDKKNAAAAEVTTVWQELYTGIRKTNIVLANIDKVPNFPVDGSVDIKERYRGEMHFLRAFLYFELVKRWGGVPIIDKILSLNGDNLDIPRSSYDDCVAFIVKDCQTAASLLPLKHADADNGRATRGAALSLKSRTLLYAARPLHNPTDDRAKWTAAAQAAKDVIDLKVYSLYPDYVSMFFQTHCDEVILNRPRTKLSFENGHSNGSGFFYRFFATQGYNGWTNNMVTQNMVDMFEDAAGYPIKQSDIYEEQHPYEKRDPRLDMCVLRNNRYWYNRNTEYWKSRKDGVNGRDRGTSNVNTLGYSCIKFWPEQHQRHKGTSTYLNYIFFRYAEILLNFAEAQNEAGGPESSLDGLTVRSVLTELRARVNHVPVPTDISATKETMRERIRNERGVELCFEEHRWYDVLSWKKGVEIFTKDIYGINIWKEADGSFTYERFKYQTPIFKEHMHLYPIPNEEVYKSENLEPNPGWL